MIISNNDDFFSNLFFISISLIFSIILFDSFCLLSLSFINSDLKIVNLLLVCSSGWISLNCFWIGVLIKLLLSKFTFLLFSSIFSFSSPISNFFSKMFLSWINEIFLFSYDLSIFNWIQLSIFWILSFFWVSFLLINIFFSTISLLIVSNFISCKSTEEGFSLLILFLFSSSIFLSFLLSISFSWFSIMFLNSLFSSFSFSLFSLIIFSTVNLILSCGASSKIGIDFSILLILNLFSEIIALLLNLLCIIFFL